MNELDFIKSHLHETNDLLPITDSIYGIKKNVILQKKDVVKKTRTLIVISGLSGSGKDSIADRISGTDLDIVRIKTCTTRLRRPEESEDNDPYIRISVQEFKTMKERGQLLESVEYAGNNYCTSLNSIVNVLESGYIPLLRVDPIGANFFIDSWKNELNIFEDTTLIYFFIISKNFDDLRKRLIIRDKNPELVQKRIEQSMKDIDHIDEAQYIVVNKYGKIDKTVKEVEKIIRENLLLINQ